jgi:acetamidase/formamidase
MTTVPKPFNTVRPELARQNILQPLSETPCPAPSSLGTGASFYVPATPKTIRWGYLPDAASQPILTVPSSSVVTFDTVSQEGLLEDQGRDPVKFFGSFGVPPDEVLHDAQAIAASSLEHHFVEDGPHIVIGPVKVEGAEPGDVLKVEFLSFTSRVPYGVIGNRHGKGSLPGEFPQTPNPEPGASAAFPERYHNVFRFVSLETVDGQLVCSMKKPDGSSIEFAAAPFLGIVGVAPNTPGPERVNSIPPGDFGGNLDIRLLLVGSALYLPVQVSGANFFVSDAHLAQGNGEVSLTAVEGSLRATMRLTVLKPGSPGNPSRAPLKTPFAETQEYWIPTGLDPDLNEAMKKAVRNAIGYLVANHGVDPASAMAYLSAAADFEVSQVVNRTKGVHVLIRKRDFGPVKK